jgi:hypothetical protein
MTKDEALKIAIEALDESMPLVFGNGVALEMMKTPLIEVEKKVNFHKKAINACKEALERQSNMVAVPLDKLQDMQRRLSDCEEYLKEDETPAECIARNRKDANTILKLLAKCMGEKKALEQPTVAKLNDEYLRDFYVEGLNQPAWQGLTDDEMDKIFYESKVEKGIVFHKTLFKTAEQELKTKNGFSGLKDKNNVN